MDSDRCKQIDSLLKLALARPPAERAAYLHEACGGDESQEREVLSLLSSHQEAGSFLEASAREVAARGLAASRSTATTLSARTISHYRIGEQLGQGGMGVVWKARDNRLDRFVAFKILSSAKMSNPEYKRRFEQEAKAASSLNHPNIVTVYEIGQADGIDFIAMEFVPGKTFEQLIQRKGLRLVDALDYAIQVADALAAAHTAGIVHRDLKPGNLMVNESGMVKLLDFGLAKAAGHADLERTETIADATAAGVIVGTASYMSPEQAEGKKVDTRSDIFSFGAVLYEMLTGRRAFSGNSMVSILSAIVRDEPKPVAEIIQGLPRELVRIVERCLRKDPSRRYQHAGDLRIDLQQVKEEPAAASATVVERRGGWHPWVVGAAACLAISLGVAWWVQRPPAVLQDWRLTRITNGEGLSFDPAVSPDGKLVAYASDSGRDSGLDLYIKQAAGGQPIRLTSDGADNRRPNFSPEGSKIVFQSNRDGISGIYEIPAFGGQVRLVARGGVRPRFSPNGSKVAYWVGSENQVQTSPGSAAVWVVPAGGGQPLQVGSNLTAARDPIWSADGRRLLLIGYTSAKLYDASSLDWWVADPDGGEAAKTGAYAALVRAGLATPSLPTPSCWSPNTDLVTFSAPAGDVRNVWEISVSPRTGQVKGIPRRVTAGGQNETSPSCASTVALAIDNQESQSNIWFLPFDLNLGKPAGGQQKITQGPAVRTFPSLSNTQRSVTFSSNQSGQFNIWTRDLITGNESMVDSSSLLQRYPVVSPSGARVAFAVNEKDERRTLYVTVPGAEPEKVCEGCTRATEWSGGEKALLVYGGTPFQVDFLDLATHRQTPLLKHPTYGLLYGHFSPDGGWISFTVRTAPNRARLAIAPFERARPIPESAWITIADAWIEDWANWSPDGRTLYFPSARDGHRCLWGQRIDPVTHRPVGEAFAAWHFHGRALYQNDGWSTAGGRIAIGLRENTGNIWLMSRSGAR